MVVERFSRIAALNTEGGRQSDRSVRPFGFKRCLIVVPSPLHADDNDDDRSMSFGLDSVHGDPRPVAWFGSCNTRVMYGTPLSASTSDDNALSRLGKVFQSGPGVGITLGDDVADIDSIRVLNVGHPCFEFTVASMQQPDGEHINDPASTRSTNPLLALLYPNGNARDMDGNPVDKNAAVIVTNRKHAMADPAMAFVVPAHVYSHRRPYTVEDGLLSDALRGWNMVGSGTQARVGVRLTTRGIVGPGNRAAARADAPGENSASLEIVLRRVTPTVFDNAVLALLYDGATHVRGTMTVHRGLLALLRGFIQGEGMGENATAFIRLAFGAQATTREQAGDSAGGGGPSRGAESGDDSHASGDGAAPAHKPMTDMDTAQNAYMMITAYVARFAARLVQHMGATDGLFGIAPPILSPVKVHIASEDDAYTVRTLYVDADAIDQTADGAAGAPVGAALELSAQPVSLFVRVLWHDGQGRDNTVTRFLADAGEFVVGNTTLYAARQAATGKDAAVFAPIRMGALDMFFWIEPRTPGAEVAVDRNGLIQYATVTPLDTRADAPDHGSFTGAVRPADKPPIGPRGEAPFAQCAQPLSRGAVAVDYAVLLPLRVTTPAASVYDTAGIAQAVEAVEREAGAYARMAAHATVQRLPDITNMESRAGRHIQRRVAVLRAAYKAQKDMARIKI